MADTSASPWPSMGTTTTSTRPAEAKANAATRSPVSGSW